ncbi:hypothetical protein AX16_003465 [Volvariella volvacea WC 439]|nr:hypothetical protein AX16_003465 [Volvariella volvacea WC 439]
MSPNSSISGVQTIPLTSSQLRARKAGPLSPSNATASSLNSGKERIVDTSVESSSLNLHAGGSVRITSPVVDKLRARKREFHEPMKVNEIRKALIEKLILQVSQQLSQPDQGAQFSFVDLLIATQKETEERLRELGYKSVDSKIDDLIRAQPAVFKYFVELGEIKYLRTADAYKSQSEEVAKYRYTCPELQGLLCYDNTQVQTRGSILEWGASTLTSVQMMSTDTRATPSQLASFCVHALEGKLSDKPWETRSPMVIIIDGIDQCGEQEIGSLVSVISTFSNLNIPLVWLLSCCHSAEIEEYLSHLKGSDDADFVIDLNDSPEAESNIQAYARAKLDSYSVRHQVDDASASDMSAQVIEKLVEGAAGQFPLVDALLNTEPADLSSILLSESAEPWTIAKGYQPLDVKYTSLLEDAMAVAAPLSQTPNRRIRRDEPGHARPSDPQLFIQEDPVGVILYHILHLSQLPSSARSISYFWGIPLPLIYQVTKCLHPVLRVPPRPREAEPLKIELPSFRSFLVAPERNEQYEILTANCSSEYVHDLGNDYPRYRHLGECIGILGIDPKPGLKLLRERRGLFFKLTAALRVAKGL